MKDAAYKAIQDLRKTIKELIEKGKEVKDLDLKKDMALEKNMGYKKDMDLRAKTKADRIIEERKKRKGEDDEDNKN